MHELWHFNARVGSRPAATGVYGLSNAGLDTPWPKLVKAKAALGKVLDDPQPEALLDLLSDPQTAPFAELPDTGVGWPPRRCCRACSLPARVTGRGRVRR
jgi:uncharacterized protein with NRDE domain